LKRPLKERKFHICAFHHPRHRSSSKRRSNRMASGRGSVSILKISTECGISALNLTCSPSLRNLLVADFNEG
jgi:hypothetical protein